MLANDDGAVAETDHFKDHLQLVGRYLTWEFDPAAEIPFKLTNEILPMHPCTKEDFKNQGFAEPNPVQKNAIDALMNYYDILCFDDPSKIRLWGGANADTGSMVYIDLVPCDPNARATCTKIS